MKVMENIDTSLSIACGVGGGIMTYLFGSWNPAIRVCLILMVLDFLTGLLIGILGLSHKSENGALSSRVCWTGLMHKGGILAVIIVAAQLEYVVGITGIRDGVVYAFCISEAISILENSNTLGAPIPAPLKRLVEGISKNVEEDNYYDYDTRRPRS